MKKVQSCDGEDGELIFLVCSGEDEESTVTSNRSSLLKRVKTQVSFNDQFGNAYGDTMRSSQKFYFVKNDGQRLIEIDPPEEIFPEQNYDVITVGPVELSEELMRETVNPEAWKLFLKHKRASTDAAKAVRELASQREEKFDIAKKEGNSWQDEVIHAKDQSIWEVEKHWDFGWYCVAATLLRKREWLAFFAFLTTIDTAVKDAIWHTVVEKVKVFGELFHECGIDFPEEGFEKFLLKDTPVRKLSPYQQKKGYLRIHKAWQIYAFLEWSNKMDFLRHFGYDDEELENCLSGHAVYPREMCQLGSLEHLSYVRSFEH